MGRSRSAQQAADRLLVDRPPAPFTSLQLGVPTVTAMQAATGTSSAGGCTLGGVQVGAE